MVDERAHGGHCRLLAPCRHPRETQGPVVLQAVPVWVQGVPPPVLWNLDRDVVRGGRNVTAASDEGGNVLGQPPPGLQG